MSRPKKECFARAFETRVKEHVDQRIYDIVDEVKSVEYKVPQHGLRFERVNLCRKEEKTGGDEETHEEDER